MGDGIILLNPKHKVKTKLRCGMVSLDKLFSVESLENKLAKSVSLLLLSMKSINPIQKYSHVIEFYVFILLNFMSVFYKYLFRYFVSSEFLNFFRNMINSKTIKLCPNITIHIQSYLTITYQYALKIYYVRSILYFNKLFLG